MHNSSPAASAAPAECGGNLGPENMYDVSTVDDLPGGSSRSTSGNLGHKNALECYGASFPLRSWGETASSTGTLEQNTYLRNRGQRMVPPQCSGAHTETPCPAIYCTGHHFFCPPKKNTRCPPIQGGTRENPCWIPFSSFNFVCSPSRNCPRPSKRLHVDPPYPPS